MNREAISYYQSVSPIIEEFCKPLNDYFSISLLTYFRAYHNDASYILLSNNKNITQKYCSTVNHEVLYSKNYLNVKSKYKLILWPINPSNFGSHIYFSEGYWHGLTIIQQDGDNFECFCFLSNKDNHRISDFFIKHHGVLEKFLEHFKTTFTDNIINESTSYKAKYKDGCDFYLPEHEAINTSDTYKFIQTTGIDKGVINLEGKFIYLTSREKQCLELIDKGFSLKGIGNKLLLSPRTIEVHLNNIKNKTGYHRRNDLIHMYRNSFMEINHE